MIAFEVQLNGEVITTAGGEDVDFLMSIIRWCRTDNGEETDIEICGQRGESHLIWKDAKLKLGDEIILRLVEVGINDVNRPGEVLIR